MISKFEVKRSNNNREKENSKKSFFPDRISNFTVYLQYSERSDASIEFIN